MSGHTPGPWRIYTPEGYEGPRDLPGLGIEAESGEAVVWYADRPETGIARDEDARLIAAAPELLDACQAARAITPDGTHTATVLDAAIRKATGAAE